MSNIYSQFPKEPDTDICPHCGATDDCMCFSEELKKELAEKTNEVARLTESLKHVELWTSFEKQIGAELEIARLRELLNRAEHSAKLWEMDALRYHQNEMYWKERAEKAEARLAPAPEEPATEWRIRAEGERIETNDQVKSCDEWHTWDGTTKWESYVGEFWKEGEVRTRRPLPKQEEMPLEDELKDIDQYADKQNDFHTCRVFQSIEYSLHYLRDEIQKLKQK